jgi:primosomal protein N'
MSCQKTGVEPLECWCESHRSGDAAEDDRRRFIGEAKFEFRGGEALHVFIRSKVTGEMASLCNLRKAVKRSALVKLVRKGHAPTLRCEQCWRTLRSRTPNARLARYFQEQRARSLELSRTPG